MNAFFDRAKNVLIKHAQHTQLGRTLAQQQQAQGGGRVNVGAGPLLNRGTGPAPAAPAMPPPRQTPMAQTGGIRSGNIGSGGIKPGFASSTVGRQQRAQDVQTMNAAHMAGPQKAGAAFPSQPSTGGGGMTPPTPQNMGRPQVPKQPTAQLKPPVQRGGGLPSGKSLGIPSRPTAKSLGVPSASPF